MHLDILMLRLKGVRAWVEYVAMPFERLTPRLTEHYVFEEPARNAALWRYMDFTRFVALLERRALFFSSMRGFSDRFEASLTEHLRAQIEVMAPHLLLTYRNVPRLTFVNCWNEGLHESVALWNMYTSASDGVAIKSSLASILEALDPDESGQNPPDELYAGRVRYVDYTTATIPAGNVFWPITHKRLAYQFEQEVRLALWPQRLLAAGAAAQPPRFVRRSGPACSARL